MRIPRIGSVVGLLVLTAVLTACGPRYSGQAKTLPVQALATEPGWTFVPELRGVRQQSEKDCGSAALASVLGYWKIDVRRSDIARELGAGRASMKELRHLSQEQGMRAFVVPGTWEDLVHEVSQERPVVIGLVQPYGRREALTHYEVVVGVHSAGNKVATFDPARGFRVRTRASLMKEWKPAKQVALIIMRS